MLVLKGTLGESFKITSGNVNIFFKEYQRIAKGAGGKGPRQKTSKSIKKFFDTFRQFSCRAKKRQKSSKIVKKCEKVFRHFSTNFAQGTIFPAPFEGL